MIKYCTLMIIPSTKVLTNFTLKNNLKLHEKD